MRAGILKHLVNVQMKTWDVGDRGQPINVVWTTLATVPVKIETLSGDKLVIARQLVPTATHEITMRFLDIPFGSGLTPFDRVMYGSRIFNIGFINNLDSLNFTLVLTVAEQQP